MFTYHEVHERICGLYALFECTCMLLILMHLCCLYVADWIALRLMFEFLILCFTVFTFLFSLFCNNLSPSFRSGEADIDGLNYSRFHQINFFPSVKSPRTPAETKLMKSPVKRRIVYGNGLQLALCSCLSNSFASCSKRLSIIITHQSVNCSQL